MRKIKNMWRARFLKEHTRPRRQQMMILTVEELTTGEVNMSLKHIPGVGCKGDPQEWVQDIGVDLNGGVQFMKMVDALHQCGWKRIPL